MGKKISGSARPDCLADRAGAYWHTLAAVSESAGQAAQLLHSKTRLSAKDRQTLLDQVETCQALALIVQQEYRHLVAEMAKSATAQATGKAVERMKREVLTEAIELAPYLVHLRSAKW